MEKNREIYWKGSRDEYKGTETCLYGREVMLK